MKNPYTVLGLPNEAEIAIVKARYRELALRYHPDKLHGVSESEREAKNELFKEITVAYHVILEGNVDNKTEEVRWKHVWERVEHIFQKQDIWKMMGDMLKDVASKYQATSHVFDLNVTLREVYENKPKKLRLFIKGLSDPVVIRAYCGSYPEYRTTITGDSDKEYDIIIRLHVLEDETLPYTIDTLFGTKDLYTQITIDWIDAIRGTQRKLQYLSGEKIVVTVPPFWKTSRPIVLKGYGATGHESESLYVSVNVHGPQEEAWERYKEVHPESASNLLDGLERLRGFQCHNPESLKC